MHWLFLLIYLLTGCFVGCFSGLLGVGGGLVVVPILYWLFKIQNLSPHYNMHIAIASSLAVMIVTSIAATYSHSKRKGVIWVVFAWIGLGMIFGGITGPLISSKLSSRSLELAFGIIEVIIALSLFLYKRDLKRVVKPNIRPVFLILIGALSALIGSMLGIGGGIIIVPFLIFAGFSSIKAVGTSAATTMLTAIIGTGCQLFSSYHLSIPQSIGFIYLPATLALALGSLVFTPLGVRLAHRLSESYLKKIFIFVLVVFGITMII